MLFRPGRRFMARGQEHSATKGNSWNYRTRMAWSGHPLNIMMTGESGPLPQMGQGTVCDWSGRTGVAPTGVTGEPVLFREVLREVDRFRMRGRLHSFWRWGRPGSMTRVVLIRVLLGVIRILMIPHGRRVRDFSARRVPAR